MPNYIFLESFTWAGQQSLPTAFSSRYNASFAGGVAPTVFATGGRFGGGRLHLEADEFVIMSSVYRASVTSGQIACGFAVKSTSFLNPTARGLASFNIRASGNQILFQTNAVGNMIALRGATTLATGTKILQSNNWYFFEYAVVIDPVAGSVRWFFDGVQDGLVTGVNTQNQASNAWDSITLGANNGQTDFCDLYVLDSGPVVGPSRVVYFPMTGNGVTNQWAPNTPPNFSQVNQNPPPGDAAFVSDGNAGDVDLYAINPLNINPLSIFALQLGITARITDAGVHTMQTAYHSSGVTFFGAAASVTASYMSLYLSLFQSDPNTGLNFSVANLNGSQFGQKLAS